MFMQTFSVFHRSICSACLTLIRFSVVSILAKITISISFGHLQDISYPFIILSSSPPPATFAQPVAQPSTSSASGIFNLPWPELMFARDV